MKSPTLWRQPSPGLAVSTHQLAFLWILFLLLTTVIQAQEYDIYVSDAGGFNNPNPPWQILKFDENGANPEVFIDHNLGWPQDILFLEDQGIVLISNLNTGLINKHNAETGALEGVFASGIGGPTRMKIGTDNLLYVLQWGGNGRVRRYDLNGTYQGEFTDVGVNQSIGLDWDTDGNLYVSSYGGRTVRKFDSDGNDQGLFINSDLLGPTNIWFDDNGDLIVLDYNGTAAKRFDSDGNYLNNFMSGLGNAEGVAYLPNGNILIGNGSNAAVKMFDADGNYLSDFISSGSGSLATPNAVVLRDRTAVNTEDALAETQLRVYPSVGRSFYLDTSSREIETISIYNSSGQLITQVLPNTGNAPIWDAGNAPAGTYLLEVAFENGQRSTAKLMVQGQ